MPLGHGLDASSQLAWCQCIHDKPFAVTAGKVTDAEKMNLAASAL
jgi:hypothetical protein